MAASTLVPIAAKFRRQWDTATVDWRLLGQLYKQWVIEHGKRGASHQMALSLFGINAILKAARDLFPKGCCGLASCLIANSVSGSRIVHGRYRVKKKKWLFFTKTTLEPHTWVMCDSLVIDITADQFGGPKIYVGPLVDPYVLKKEA